jgi:hypothetical protein
MDGIYCILVNYYAYSSRISPKIIEHRGGGQKLSTSLTNKHLEGGVAKLKSENDVCEVETQSIPADRPENLEIVVFQRKQ